MARKIVLVSGLNVYETGTPIPPPANNLLCCLPCQEVNVIFENVHNSPLTITALSIQDDVTLTATITSINGSAPSFPFVVADGDTFNVKFQICRGTGAPSPYWKFYFDTVEHRIEDFYYVPMSCVTIDSLASIDTINFIDVVPGTTVTETGSITNNTLEGFTYTISLCPGLTGTNLTATVPVGATIGFTISWSPTSYPEIISCVGSISVNENPLDCTTKLSIDGNTVNYDCDAEGGICCLNVTLNTENGYIDAVDTLCEGIDLYNQAAILEKKQVIYDLKFFEALTNGTAIYFNPYLFSTNTNPFASFLSSTNPPPQCYTVTYNTGLLNGNPYTMNLTNMGANGNNQKNIQAYITFLDPANGMFRITLDFFVVCDRNFMINNSVFSNKFKYQKSTLNDPGIYGNTFASVYNQNEYISAYFQVQKGLTKRDFVHNLPFTGRFYNSGLYATPSEFTSPNFNLSRTVGNVTELSSFEPTKMTFNITVDTGTYVACDYIVFHLVDETLNDNTLQFLAATDASRAEIDNNAGPAVLDNHLIAPSTFTYLGSDVYEASCYIDINLDATHQYRMFAIVYSRNDVVNTFKSDSYRVRTVPEYDCDCKPEVTSYWDNYYETLESYDYRPVGKERIQHRLVLKEGTIGSCLANWGLSIPDWRVALTGIKLRIYKRYMYFPVSNDPNTDYCTFFEFGNFYSSRNGAAVGNWDNFTALDVLDVNTDEIHVSINNVRVLWENTSFNGNVSQCKIQTYMDKYPITGATATSYVSTLNVLNTWIDDDIYFEYEFEFDLSSYFGSFFKFHICEAHRVSAISFENVNSGFPPVITNVSIQGFDPTIGSYVPLTGNFISASSYTYIQLIYEINEPGPLYGWFNFFIETAPFGLPTLVESNAVASPNDLDNYGLAPIMSSQSYLYQLYGGNVIAVATIDVSQLQATSYLFCGYWTQMTGQNNCKFFNIHTRPNGSPQIQMLTTPTYADFFELALFGATTNNYVYITSAYNIANNWPTPGQTYKIFYTFSTPTTQLIYIWIGQHGQAGLPNAVIPVGSQVGFEIVTWPFVANGNWTIKLLGGGDISGYWSFALGGEDCDKAPWEE